MACGGCTPFDLWLPSLSLWWAKAFKVCDPVVWNVSFLWFVMEQNYFLWCHINGKMLPTHILCQNHFLCSIIRSCYILNFIFTSSVPQNCYVTFSQCSHTFFKLFTLTKTNYLFTKIILRLRRLILILRFLFSLWRGKVLTATWPGPQSNPFRPFSLPHWRKNVTKMKWHLKALG